MSAAVDDGPNGGEIGVAIQAIIIIVGLLGFNGYNAYRDEQRKDKPQWQQQRNYLKSTDHFLTIAMSTVRIIVILLSLTIDYNYDRNGFIGSVSFFIIVYLYIDCISTMYASAKLLRSEYGMAYNPAWSFLILIYIASFLCWLLFLTDTYIHRFTHWFYTLILQFTIAHSILELQYFRLAYYHIYSSDAAVVAGITGFLRSFRASFFRVVYLAMKVVLLIVWLAAGHQYTRGFYRIGFPILLQIWDITAFFLRANNRPHPQHFGQRFHDLWRTIVENEYSRAIGQATGRRESFIPPKMTWHDKDGNVLPPVTGGGNTTSKVAALGSMPPITEMGDLGSEDDSDDDNDDGSAPVTKRQTTHGKAIQLAHEMFEDEKEKEKDHDLLFTHEAEYGRTDTEDLERAAEAIVGMAEMNPETDGRPRVTSIELVKDILEDGLDSGDDSVDRKKSYHEADARISELLAEQMDI